MTVTNESSLSAAAMTSSEACLLASQRCSVPCDVDDVKENVTPSMKAAKRARTSRGQNDHSCLPRLPKQPEPLVSILRSCVRAKTAAARLSPLVGEKIMRVRFEEETKIHAIPSRHHYRKEEIASMYMSPSDIVYNASRNHREYVFDGCVMENAREEECFIETVLPDGRRGLVHPATFSCLQENDNRCQRIVELLEQMWQGGTGCSGGEFSDGDFDNETKCDDFYDEDRDDSHCVVPLASTCHTIDNEEIGRHGHVGQPTLRRSAPVDFSGFRLEIEDLEDEETDIQLIHYWVKAACT